MLTEMLTDFFFSFVGILEAQPLHFVCISASEGSKVELLKSKITVSKGAKGPTTQFGPQFPMAQQQVSSQSSMVQQRVDCYHRYCLLLG